MTRFRIQVARASLNRTIKALESINPSVGRRALRTGVAKAGAETLKDSRAAAPVGRTGQFRRSLAKKDIRYAAKGVYVSIVGQKRRKHRRSTPLQIARANRRTGLISKGLSGQGKEPSISWINFGTKPHTIRAKNRSQMYWNVGAGRTRISPPRHATVVRHPGHRGTGFLTRVHRQGRNKRIRTIQREIIRELQKLGIRRLRP